MSDMELNKEELLNQMRENLTDDYARVELIVVPVEGEERCQCIGINQAKCDNQTLLAMVKSLDEVKEEILDNAPELRLIYEMEKKVKSLEKERNGLRDLKKAIDDFKKIVEGDENGSNID